MLPLLTNILYTWVGYHANTFSWVVIGNYWNFRPSMLKKEVPYSAEDWADIKVGEEMAHSKVLLNVLKVTATSLRRDSDDTLLGMMKKQEFAVRDEVEMGTAPDLHKHRQLLASLEELVAELKSFEEEVNALNAKKQAVDRIDITWLNPSDMQNGIHT